jgi:hypothetical protein
MYLHLGKGVLVREESIVAIFDLDVTSQSHLTRKYLAAADKAGEVVNAAEDIPKSFLVCREDGGQRVYLSQMSVSTLLRRAESGMI